MTSEIESAVLARVIKEEVAPMSGGVIYYFLHLDNGKRFMGEAQGDDPVLINRVRDAAKADAIQLAAKSLKLI